MAFGVCVCACVCEQEKEIWRDLLVKTSQGRGYKSASELTAKIAYDILW